MKDFFKKKQNLYILGALVLLFLAYYYMGDIKAMLKRSTSSAKNEVGDIDENETLKKGDSGASVVALQNLILSKDSNSLPKYGADGVFGMEVENALYSQIGKRQISIAAYKNATGLKNTISKAAQMPEGQIVLN